MPEFWGSRSPGWGWSLPEFWRFNGHGIRGWTLAISLGFGRFGVTWSKDMPS